MHEPYQSDDPPSLKRVILDLLPLLIALGILAINLVGDAYLHGFHRIAPQQALELSTDTKIWALVRALYLLFPYSVSLFVVGFICMQLGLLFPWRKILFYSTVALALRESIGPFFNLLNVVQWGFVGIAVAVLFQYAIERLSRRFPSVKTWFSERESEWSRKAELCQKLRDAKLAWLGPDAGMPARIIGDICLISCAMVATAYCAGEIEAHLMKLNGL